MDHTTNLDPAIQAPRARNAAASCVVVRVAFLPASAGMGAAR
ncbi:hypothetical protein BURK1_00495 [Burkholderiales bacterium]|nr:hypothetical protein BURK1_00495 [Burkholderiales bacterium]